MPDGGKRRDTAVKAVEKPSLEQVIAQADQLRTAGQLLAAARQYEAWITANDSPSKCVALFNLGVLRSDLGDLNGAEAAYAEAIGLNPRLYQGHINAGLVAERKKQDVEAVRHWLAAEQGVMAATW